MRHEIRPDHDGVLAPHDRLSRQTPGRRNGAGSIEMGTDCPVAARRRQQ
ncbi:hypothetical protein [Streptomyces sp. 2224.1]|nr:hypothetical protein [Streptomyces sp. 2224.1]